MANNKQIAEKVLAAVGGKDNVTSITHCMTRLRFNLKDQSLPKDDEVKQIEGVLGVVRTGGQYQVVIGQNVPKVYAEMCSIGGFAAQAAVEENLDAPKEKLTAKGIGNSVLNFMAGSLTPLIPPMITAAMFKTVLTILGPDMLGLIGLESNLYITLDFLYDAFFYFLPIFVGYTAAKKIGLNPSMGLYAGAILLVPDFVALAGAEFTVFGIPCITNNYSQSLLPILLTIPVMHQVYKLWSKIVPDVLSTVFVPFLTMVVMVPVSLCGLAPLGSILGNWIGNGLVAFGGVGGFFAAMVIAALWEFLVMSGMHMVVVMFAITNMMTIGYDVVISPAASCATCAAWGIALGAFLRLKDKKEKGLNLGYFISGVLGGVTEPALYGVGFRYKKPFVAMAIGAAAGALYASITGVKIYVLGATSALAALGYVTGGTGNFVNGIISMVISVIAAAALTYFFGFTKDEIEGKSV